MNKHDRDNLAFLMVLTPEAVAAWYESVSADDHAYALELLHTAQIEFGINTDVEDVSDAKAELSRFTLKGKA